MAVCSSCNLEMTDDKTISCTATEVEYPDGTKLPSIPYVSSGTRCHDCYVVNSGIHHPGCDMERCPRCKCQLISCDCLDED